MAVGAATAVGAAIEDWVAVGAIWVPAEMLTGGVEAKAAEIPRLPATAAALVAWGALAAWAAVRALEIAVKATVGAGSSRTGAGRGSSTART